MCRSEAQTVLQHLLSRALGFVAVGGTATLIQYLLLVLLIEVAGRGEILAAGLAYGLAAGANYLLNYYFTFSAAGSTGHDRALPRFVIAACIGLGINTLCFSLLVPLMHYLLAQVGATAVTLIVNFVLHQFWIYRSSPWTR